MRSYYRDYKKSSSNLFRADFAVSLDCTDKNYDSFENTVIKTHNTRMKKKTVRANEVPHETKTVRQAITKSLNSKVRSH